MKEKILLNTPGKISSNSGDISSNYSLKAIHLTPTIQLHQKIWILEYIFFNSQIFRHCQYFAKQKLVPKLLKKLYSIIFKFNILEKIFFPIILYFKSVFWRILKINSGIWKYHDLNNIFKFKNKFIFQNFEFLKFFWLKKIFRVFTEKSLKKYDF